MREKTRQIMLKAGTGLTRKQAEEMVNRSRWSSWDGCLSGSDWCGIKVKLGDSLLNAGYHRQNSAPTGWEDRGGHSIAASFKEITRGSKLTVLTRNAAGRNPAGEVFYRTTAKQIVVV